MPKGLFGYQKFILPVNGEKIIGNVCGLVLFMDHYSYNYYHLLYVDTHGDVLTYISGKPVGYCKLLIKNGELVARTSASVPTEILIYIQDYTKTQ